MIVSGRGWNYVGVAVVIVNCTVKHAVKNDTNRILLVYGSIEDRVLIWLPRLSFVGCVCAAAHCHKTSKSLQENIPGRLSNQLCIGSAQMACQRLSCLFCRRR